jgi:hypothetical protein
MSDKTQAESEKDFDSDYKRWLSEIEIAEKDRKSWIERGDKVVKRYLDEKKDGEEQNGQRFNILWSNVQTIQPILFARPPKAQVERRYRDKDPVGRLASMMLERSLDYCVEDYNLADTVRACVENLLLPGLGQAWVRYEPRFEKVRVPVQPAMPQIPGQAVDVTVEAAPAFIDDSGQSVDPKSVKTDEQGSFIETERIAYEKAPVEYVHWKDFLHGPGRVWAEVNWVARIVYMTKDEATDRFGEEKAKACTYDCKPEEIKDDHLAADVFKKCRIYELWDKQKREVIWLSKGMDKLLDKKPDPLNLHEFFPCPRPLLATTANGKLVPQPDYCMYQDQAVEMDELTQRIALLTQACRVVGVYAAQEKDTLSGILNGSDNQMVPVDQWAAFAEKGGIKGAIDWLPVDMVIQVIDRLYIAREACKATIYEITGIADIVRGQSDPNETLGAQRIKGQFATLRLDDRQKDVARFVRDLIRLKAEIIAEMFQPETIVLMSGIEQSSQDAQLVPQAIELLRNDALRSFRIDIETDSTIAVDEAQEKSDRAEFLTSAATFLEKALPIAQGVPQIAPLLGQMLLFGVRGFRVSRDLESAFEEAIEAMQQQAQQPAEPRPDPEMVKVQGQLQAKAAKDQGELALQARKQQGEFALKEREQAMDAELDAVKAANMPQPGLIQ